MKMVFLITLSCLFTGCAMNPYRMANYWPEHTVPSTSATVNGTATARSTTALPTGVIVTRSGNLVVIPNYSTGGVSAVLGPR